MAETIIATEADDVAARALEYAAEKAARALAMQKLEAATLADLQDGEQMWPIYKVDIRWSEKTPPDSECRSHRVGDPVLPEGRRWNSCGWSKMEPEGTTPEDIALELRSTWWPKYIENKRIIEPGDRIITSVLIRRDVWCEGWFSHYTYDVGMNDQQVLASFGRYVDRILSSDLTETWIGGMLMSAEDHWRWHGCADGNPQGERTPAPCRCPHCKAAGLIRIDH